MNFADVMKPTERIAFALRSLYRQYGYTRYKMSKFEEYDLYARNKEFLVSDSIITFTDTNGRLMALKPDVTLSIVRADRDEPEGLRRVCYEENVYRVSGGVSGFREILQAGLECIGRVDAYALSEALILAARSLQTISDECVLTVSHLGIVAALIDELGVSGEYRARLTECIGGKNLHELASLCAEAGADPAAVERLLRLTSLNGTPREVLPELKSLGCAPEAVAQLETVTANAEACVPGHVLRIDFSVVNDMRYYNGIVFTGFVRGVPAGVLSGGQYDRLLEKMGRRSGAVGFAVYLDMLERAESESEMYDADVLLRYEPGAEAGTLCRAAEDIIRLGQTVMVLPCEPAEGIRCRSRIEWPKEEG